MERIDASVLLVLLALLIAGAWLTKASAQEAPPQTLSGAPSLAASQTQPSENLAPGTIPQPTIASPGLVTGLTLGELYTDNLTLAAADQPKQSSFITEIQPFIKSAFNTPRLTGIFNYTLTGYAYSGTSHHNQLAQDLNALADLTILPEHFFLEGTALYGREIINNQQPSSSATYFLTNNNANAATGTLSPYWLQDLGPLGSLTLRYTRGRVVYNTRGIPAQNDNALAGIPNVTSNAQLFNLVSPRSQTWGWNLLYSDQRLEPDFGTGVEFALAKLGLSLQASFNTKLLADAGRETNFLPDGTEQKLGAKFWDAGFEWSNTLDDFMTLIGHRFYGHSYQISWTHNAALLTTALSYTEQPTNYNQQVLAQSLSGLAAAPLSISFLPSLQQRVPYLSKRLTGSLTYTMPKSTLDFTVYDELRTYFALNSSQERVANAQLSWRFNIGVFTTLTPTYGWQRYQFQGGQINYNHFEQLALIHQFGVNDSGSLQLRSDSSNVYYGVPGAHDYRVNVIFLQWTHLF